MYDSLIICPKLIPAFFKNDCHDFHLIDNICPLSQVCFVNLDVNKDACSTEHLQQVALGTGLSGNSLQGLAVLTRELTWLPVNDAHFVGDSLIRWFHHSPSPWPLSCYFPTQFALLIFVKLAFPSRQALSPAHQCLGVAFLLSPSPLSNTQSVVTFPRFLQNPLDTS